MRKQINIFYLLSIVIVFPFVLIYPQTGQYEFRHLTTEDGLPTNYSHQVLKDSRGFIWISTRAGLCRYDGYNMKVFQYDPLDSTSLSDNRISDTYNMVEDNDGKLWIGTANGLNRYDPVTETFKRYKHNPDDPGSISNDNIYCLYRDAEGTLWVSTSWTYGLNKYDPETDKFRVYQHNPEDSNFQAPTILSMLEDRTGILWLGTSKGVYQFDRENEEFIHINFYQGMPDKRESKWIKNIFEDTDGTILFGTQKGFFIYDTINNEIKPFPPLYDEHEALNFIDAHKDPFEPEKIIWIAAEPLYKYNKLNQSLSLLAQNPEDTVGIIGSNLHSIFSDEFGMLWIAGTKGINILNPGKSQIEEHKGFAQKYTNAITFLEDHNGHFWIGADWYLVHFDQEMNFVRSYPSFPVTEDEDSLKSGIWRIYEDSENNLWVGTIFYGLYCLEYGKSSFIHCQLPPSGNIHVYDIFEDSDGILWIGTNRGLFQHKKGEYPLSRFSQDTAWGIFNKTIVLSINEDHTGNLWFGTIIHGLFRQPHDLRGSTTFLQYKHDPNNDQSLSNDWVWCVYEDVFDNLWIATENGLNKYISSDDNFERYINKSDLGANFIYDLTGDDNGYLWLTTESGLIRFNTNETGNNFKQILPFNNINPYRIYQNKAGKLFVGNHENPGKGYYSFYPDSLFENQHPPPVVITRFLVRNKEIKPDSSILFKKQIRLDYDQNFFSFEFAALDYFDPSKNQYAYMLQGLDDEWTYSGNRRLARYTKVPPGSYVFRVKGSNNDGYWNETGTSIAITILPPPWKTWWAYSLYFLFIASAIYVVIRYYLRRQRLLHELALEHVQTEKLEELDRMKSRFFANISHEFRTPLTLILGPLQKVFSKISDEETKQDLNIMQRNALRLQTLINQLLSLSKLESGKMKLQAKEEDIVALVNGYIQSFESLAKQKKIDLNFKSTEKDISLFVDKDKIEKTLYNLLSNAFKFTGEKGRIEVEVSRQSSVSSQQSVPKGETTAGYILPTADSNGPCVSLSISDTGCGIPPEKIEHIFDRFYQGDDSYTKDQEGTGIGLALTKELVEIHHGKITVESILGKGTTFTVYLPMGKEHLKLEEIDDPGSYGNYLNQEVESVEIADKFTGSPIQEKAVNDDIHDNSKPLLLIVEDNDDLRAYIRSFLMLDYRVSEAIDGDKGYEKAVEKIPDLVISDVMMPKMDGFELCEKLKTDERTSHIPVILLTARAGKESKIEGLETGADDFITKPFDNDELLTRIKNLIEQRKKLHERFMQNISKTGFDQFLKFDSADFSSVDKNFLKKASGYIMANISDPDLNVELLAEKMALSRRQLQRKFVGITGNSPGKFIRSVRLNRAAELITGKSGNITEIAFEAGFNNLSWFAKSFKEQFGVLPSEYPPEGTE